jgi:hypothetical protein
MLRLGIFCVDISHGYLRLDPKGGFSVLMACTDKHSFGRRTGLASEGIAPLRVHAGTTHSELAQVTI